MPLKPIEIETLNTLFEKTEVLSQNMVICKNPDEEWISKYPQFKLEKGGEYLIRVRSSIGKILNHVWDKDRTIFQVDYFLLISFYDEPRLYPTYAWLLDEGIYYNNIDSKTCLTHAQASLISYGEYELSDKLDFKQIYTNLEERCNPKQSSPESDTQNREKPKVIYKINRSKK